MERAAVLFYASDREYAVELGDRVELPLTDGTFAGVVTKLHPRALEVTVRYEDHHDTYRTTSNPRQKTVRLPIEAVDLVGRDA